MYEVNLAAAFCLSAFVEESVSATKTVISFSRYALSTEQFSPNDLTEPSFISR